MIHTHRCVRIALLSLALLGLHARSGFALGTEEPLPTAPDAALTAESSIDPSLDAPTRGEFLNPAKATLLPAIPGLPEHHEHRTGAGDLSYGVRGAFLAPENDLYLTSTNFPQFSVGAQGQLRLHEVHQIRPALDWWYFRQGHQQTSGPPLDQSLNTNVRSIALGGEYLYRLGRSGRFSVGGQLYLMRWSVHSVNTLTDGTLGSFTSSGTSHWYHLGEGPAAGYRLSQRLELQGRWVHSHYGYEHIPISVLLVGAAWRL